MYLFIYLFRVGGGERHIALMCLWTLPVPSTTKIALSHPESFEFNRYFPSDPELPCDTNLEQKRLAWCPQFPKSSRSLEKNSRDRKMSRCISGILTAFPKSPFPHVSMEELTWRVTIFWTPQSFRKTFHSDKGYVAFMDKGKPLDFHNTQGPQWLDSAVHFSTSKVFLFFPLRCL